LTFSLLVFVVFKVLLRKRREKARPSESLIKLTTTTDAAPAPNTHKAPLLTVPRVAVLVSPALMRRKMQMRPGELSMVALLVNLLYTMVVRVCGRVQMRIVLGVHVQTVRDLERRNTRIDVVRLVIRGVLDRGPLVRVVFRDGSVKEGHLGLLPAASRLRTDTRWVHGVSDGTT
jgi:hypothetical protein